MTNVIPQITVTDPRKRGNFTDQNSAFATTIEGGPLSSKKLTPKLRSPASPSEDAQIRVSIDGRRTTEAPIDPLSQQILQRTNTSPAIQKLRSQNTEPIASPPSATLHEGHVDKELGGDLGAASKADKRKSFLSRLIGSNKKKGDSTSENGYEADDLRPEGMDALPYINNVSFSPKIPQPPAYIKVKTKFKKEKEFDRVFLAQELQSGSDKHSSPAAGSNPAPQSGSAAIQNPVWAVEFSKDGRYLAAGGQDRIVRVWAVISSAEDRKWHEKAEQQNQASIEGAEHLSAPVFQQKTFRAYSGHTATILDLSWSKNNFLLSSSMDKTVRLWHVSRDENLCTFKHADFVPSIQFHPTDDRFFLAGSLDAKLRLWSIPDKNVAFVTSVPDMITAVAFTPDGKTCIAGTLGGLLMFYETEGLKWQSQVHVKSTRGQNAKGSKVTGIQATYWPPGSESGEIKLLITSNDSRLRVYNFKDKSLEMKFKGHENNCSQIRASFSDSSGHVICGSEDRKAYIWSLTVAEGDKSNQRPVEMFEAHNSITTCTVIAPVQTRQLLSASEDPIYDICNPPPVTLVSRAQSVASSRAQDETVSALPTPATVDASFKKAAESPAYVARSTHRGGNIIVTADYTGAIKVYRQDCAFAKRIRLSETWDTSSLRRTGSKIGRPSSILSRTSRSRRESISTQPPNDRIMTWRQGISHGSVDSTNSSLRRGTSPRKSLARLSLTSVRPPEPPSLRPTQTNETLNSTFTGTPRTSVSIERTPHSQAASQSGISTPPNAEPRTASTASQNPLALYNGQSWAFWTNRDKIHIPPPENVRPDLDARASGLSQSSRLTMEMSDRGEGEGDRDADGKEMEKDSNTYKRFYT